MNKIFMLVMISLVWTHAGFAQTINPPKKTLSFEVEPECRDREMERAIGSKLNDGGDSFSFTDALAKLGCTNVKLLADKPGSCVNGTNGQISFVSDNCENLVAASCPAGSFAKTFEIPQSIGVVRASGGENSSLSASTSPVVCIHVAI